MALNTILSYDRVGIHNITVLCTLPSLCEAFSALGLYTYDPTPISSLAPKELLMPLPHCIDQRLNHAKLALRASLCRCLSTTKRRTSFS